MPKEKKSEVLRKQLDSIRAELLELDEVDDPTDDQASRAQELLLEFDTTQEAYTEQLAHEKKVDAVRAASFNPAQREPGDGPALRSRADPYSDLERVRSANINDREVVSGLRSRALYAIELAAEHLTADQQARAEHLVRYDEDGPLSQHILLTGSPDYHRAFRGLLKSQGNPALLEPDEFQAYKLAEAHRRAMNLTDAAGGFLVPFTLDPTIILTNTGSANPFRRVAQIKTTVTDEWNGVTSAGVNAEWLAEAQQAADASPAFLGPKITPKKAGAWIQGSFEVFADSGFAADVGPLITDAKDRLEAAAFATGNGTTQPKGVITAVSAVGGSVVATITADTYAVGDVYAVEQALPPRYRLAAAPVWMAAKAIINKTRQFDTAGGSSFWANLGMGQPEQLLGAPIYEASTMDGVIDAAQNNYILIVGDFKQFYIVDRIGTTMVYEPLVKGAAGRPTGEAGWFAYWRVGSDVVNADAFRLLNA